MSNLKQVVIVATKFRHGQQTLFKTDRIHVDETDYNSLISAGAAIDADELVVPDQESGPDSVEIDVHSSKITSTTTL